MLSFVCLFRKAQKRVFPFSFSILFFLWKGQKRGRNLLFLRKINFFGELWDHMFCIALFVRWIEFFVARLAHVPHVPMRALRMFRMFRCALTTCSACSGAWLFFIDMAHQLSRFFSSHCILALIASFCNGKTSQAGQGASRTSSACAGRTGRVLRFLRATRFPSRPTSMRSRRAIGAAGRIFCRPIWSITRMGSTKMKASSVTGSVICWWVQRRWKRQA